MEGLALCVMRYGGMFDKIFLRVLLTKKGPKQKDK